MRTNRASEAKKAGERRAYAQSALPDTDQNAVYGRGDGGYDDAGFRPGRRDEDRHYGARHAEGRPGAEGEVTPDPTDGTRKPTTRGERDARGRPQHPSIEQRGRSPR